MKYRISIPEPCHEDWQKMTPQEQGRFCDKCQKCVVDFTGLSTQQMFQHIHSGKDLCGRFRSDQLNRIITETPIKKSRSFQYLFSSALAFLGANQVFGQAEHPQIVGKVIPKTQSIQSSDAALNKVVQVSGTVRNLETKEPVSSAVVAIPTLNLTVLTNADGTFTIEIPKEKWTANLKLKAEYFGYDPVEVNLTHANEHFDLVIKERTRIEVIAEPQLIEVGGRPLIECDSVAMQEMLQVDPLIEDEFEPTFWQKIGNWFRNIF